MEDVVNTLDNGYIQHIFEFNNGILYRDALVMSQEDYNLLSADQITIMKQARFNNWLAVINATPIEET